MAFLGIRASRARQEAVETRRIVLIIPRLMSNSFIGRFRGNIPNLSITANNKYIVALGGTALKSIGDPEEILRMLDQRRRKIPPNRIEKAMTIFSLSSALIDLSSVITSAKSNATQVRTKVKGLSAVTAKIPIETMKRMPAQFIGLDDLRTMAVEIVAKARVVRLRA